MPLSTNQGPYGGGTPVTISGTNLSNPIAVYFGGNLGTSVVGVDSTHVTVVSPAGAGAVELIVETSSGKSNPVPYYYIQPPFISELSPVNGATAGTNTVTISGVGLTSVSSVMFGATAGTTISAINDGSITVVVPDGVTAGTVNVSVTTSGGIASGLEYTYVDPPTTAGITPGSGSESGGTVITLTGTNLTTTSLVTVGGTLSNFIVVDDSTITVITPAGSGVVDVQVTTVGGAASPLTSAFTYGALPAI